MQQQQWYISDLALIIISVQLPDFGFELRITSKNSKRNTKPRGIVSKVPYYTLDRRRDVHTYTSKSDKALSGHVIDPLI